MMFRVGIPRCIIDGEIVPISMAGITISYESDYDPNWFSIDAPLPTLNRYICLNIPYVPAIDKFKDNLRHEIIITFPPNKEGIIENRIYCNCVWTGKGFRTNFNDICTSYGELPIKEPKDNFKSITISFKLTKR